MGVGERTKGLTLRLYSPRQEWSGEVGFGRGAIRRAENLGGIKAVGSAGRQGERGKEMDGWTRERRRRILLKYVKTVIKIEKSREKF